MFYRTYIRYGTDGNRYGGTWYTVLRSLYAMYGIRGLKCSESCSQIITVRKIRGEVLHPRGPTAVPRLYRGYIEGILRRLATIILFFYRTRGDERAIVDLLRRSIL